MPRDMVRMGVRNERQALTPVGIQPKRRFRQQDASFDELVRNRGFQKGRGQKGGFRAGAGSGGGRIRASRGAENHFAETAGAPWRRFGRWPSVL